VLVSHISLWPFSIVIGCCTVGASVVRCLFLFMGLVLTLREARPEDRPEIFREFARAVAHRAAGPWQASKRRQLVPEESEQPIPEPPTSLEGMGAKRGT
jgi:hypothetical protein